MPDISHSNWSERDDHNAEVAPNGFPPGLPAQIETIGQMVMGAIKRFWNRSNPAYITAGSADNYTVTTEGKASFLNLYEIIRVRIDRANTTTTPTLKFSSTTARTIVKVTSAGIVPLVIGDLQAGRDHSFYFDGTNFILSNPATIDASVAVGLLKSANNLSDVANAATSRTNLGLGNVNNTSDANKPVSTAQGTAIAASLATAEAYTDTGVATRMPLAGGTFSGPVDMAGNALKNVGAGVPDFISGLITANNSTTSIDVGVGSMKSNSRSVVNAGTVTKSLFAVWAAGTGVGGRDTAAAVTANTTYHLHAIQNNSTGGFDWLYSLSATAPTVPGGYTLVGRFWSIYTTAAGTGIVPYVQDGNTCYTTAQLWFTSTVAIGSGPQTIPAANVIPAGISVDALLLIALTTTSTGGSATITINAIPIVTNPGNTIQLGLASSGTITTNITGYAKTTTSKQLAVSLAISGTASASVTTGGWVDWTLPRLGGR